MWDGMGGGCNSPVKALLTTPWLQNTKFGPAPEPTLPPLECEVIKLDNWQVFGAHPDEGPAVAIMFNQGSEKLFHVIQDEVKYQLGTYSYQSSWLMPVVLNNGTTRGSGLVFVNKKPFKQIVQYLNKEMITITKKHSHPGKKA